MKIIEKIIGDKKTSGIIYILLAVGIAMVCAGNLFPKTAPTVQTKPVAAKTRERQLEEILSEIKGAGKVRVMITYSSSAEKHYIYDGDGKQKKTVIVSKQGSQEPLIEKQSSAKVAGVIVVASGAKSPKVREKLQGGVCTALSIAPHKVQIFEGKEAK